MQALILFSRESVLYCSREVRQYLQLHREFSDLLCSVLVSVIFLYVLKQPRKWYEYRCECGNNVIFYCTAKSNQYLVNFIVVDHIIY